MDLDDRHGTRFELSLVGYQHPEISDDEYDANRLSVRVDLRTSRGYLSQTEPALLTWEVGWLALWLENLAREIRQDERQDFTEPNLSFRHVSTEGDLVALQVGLSQEF